MFSIYKNSNVRNNNQEVSFGSKKEISIPLHKRLLLSTNNGDMYVSLIDKINNKYITNSGKTIYDYEIKNYKEL